VPAIAAHPRGVPISAPVDAAPAHHAAPAPTAAGDHPDCLEDRDRDAADRLVIVVCDDDDPRPLPRGLGDERARRRRGIRAGLPTHRRAPRADVWVQLARRVKRGMHRDRCTPAAPGRGPGGPGDAKGVTGRAGSRNRSDADTGALPGGAFGGLYDLGAAHAKPRIGGVRATSRARGGHGDTP
jgi:hypothetical protein